ncbi:hypothetical protein [Salinirubrum litoreum]|uniref:Uncharacterized protein n=1 Tax=Salinirubrum litoreum TaxID=1126234 RepID=A0ABD5R7J4_9EURY|nr:hypothetical protein [Salinirubrum litoreum]
MANPDTPGEDFVDPAPLNTLAVVGLVGFLVVGVGSLFALPAIQSLTGLGFFPVFWSIVALNFVCAVGVGLSVLNLRG